VRYFRTRSLLEAMRIAQADGSYPRLLTQLAAVPLLILDDWGMEGMSLAQRSDLLDLLDARHGTAATLIASQLPAEKWYEVIGEATFADAILDRLIHRALRIELKGESMRRRQSGER
jgi:DNA replication protein DnaC